VSATQALRSTPLHERHREAGARLVPFAGWEMPVQYQGIRAEHLVVRSAAGVFDVSHMGQIEVSGPQAADLLQRVLSNDISRLEVGGAQYSVICREDGGVLDDTFTYRPDGDRFLTVTNASNHQRDLAWVRDHAAPYDCDVVDRLADYAMLAVQGPRARELTSTIADAELPARLHTAQLNLAGAAALVCGTGYTGEDGIEVLMDPNHATDVWDALVDAGVTPAGLGARDTLRLEVCYPLYGNDLTEERGPIEAGLGWCCKEDTGFVGSEAVAAVRERGPAEKLVAFRLRERGIPRQGNPVVGGGEVTSGTLSPSLGVGIGMAYLPAERARPGEEIEVDVRGALRPAVVVDKPIYRKED
jgi:aminomethyltransferase